MKPYKRKGKTTDEDRKTEGSKKGANGHSGADVKENRNKDKKVNNLDRPRDGKTT
jgi:hypothetical protein